MITQSISCDMCGVQKREANHWFIAYKEAHEIRISGWASPRCQRRDGAPVWRRASINFSAISLRMLPP